MATNPEESMFPEQELTLQLWHVPYVLYILWISGLMEFYKMASSKSGQEKVSQFRLTWTGRIHGLWIGISLIAAGFAWPLLIGLPILIVDMGAPTSAGIIAGTYAFLGLYLGGRQLMERWSVLGTPI